MIYNKSDKQLIINQIIPKLNKDFIKKIKHQINYSSLITSSHSFEPNCTFIPRNGKEKYLFYYFYDFIMISEETLMLLEKEFLKILKPIKLKAFIGDDKIFIIIISSSFYLIEVGNLNEDNIFIPDIFLTHEENTGIKKTINLLLLNGYEKYCNYYLLFNNDYISRIFDEDNDFIGFAYRYKPSFTDYQHYLIKETFLEYVIKLYFSHHFLKQKMKSKKLLSEDYYLINKKYLKENKKYSNILESLSNNALVKQIEDSLINTELNEKKLSIIIKNIQFKEIMDSDNILSEEEMPKYELFNIGKDNIFYFNDFQVVNKNIYKILFEQQKENSYQCILLDDCLLINITKNNEINKIVLEVCYLDEKLELIPKYLLTYKNGDDFLRHIQYLYKIEIYFKTFIEGLQFNSNKGISLHDENEEEIGYIYEISLNENYKPKDLNIIPKKDFNDDKNKDIEIKPLTIYNSIKEEFSIQPKIGLKNVGATCYMNAALQCFVNITKFVDYFKYKCDYILKIIEEYSSQGDLCLTESFKYLIENLWPSNNNNYILSEYTYSNSNNKYFSPIEFKKKISKMNELFKGVQANDAKDLINFLIMTLHQELNKAPKNKNENNSNLQIDQNNKDLILNNFIQSFYNENQSLISDIFYGVSDNCTKCSSCNIPKYSFQIYFFLIFPLEEVRKFKIQEEINQFMINNQNMMNINPVLYQQNLSILQSNCQKINSVNIYDCFKHNQKIETFTGENAMYCNNCKGQFNSDFQSILYTSPEILIIILNRGKGIQYKVKCEFTLDLNLFDFIEMKNTGYMYDLIGVVTHLGGSDASGHFISYCRSPIDNNWYQYNDDLVSSVNNFQNDVINYAMPYILFYQKQKFNGNV